MNQFSLIGFLILAVVVATFSVQNSGEAVVKFIWWQFQSSLVVMILISTALGAIMAIFLSLPGTFRLRMRLREQSQHIAELEQRLRERETTRTRDTPDTR
ncbi:LapA family protein [Candidatus Methylomirabilis sp.]|uniref:LapA family protein n=1 Tax=Candidatus Methylomirabilis tolerans TaxID=3123416 RepID=A0AAJ1AG66_9BACT|nr:LapA family protein [Candidatus Methylomirabilis sp.]